MDQFIAFAQERWIVIVLAILAVLIIVKVVKHIVKWLMILIIAAALLIYGYNYADDLGDIGAKLGELTEGVVSQN